MQMESGLGTSFRNYDNGISYKAFGKGSTVFLFDLTADQSNGKHTDPTRHGNLRDEVGFGVALTNPVMKSIKTGKFHSTTWFK